MARHLLTYLRAVFNNVIKGNPELQAKYGLEVNPADRVGRGGRYGTQRVDERYLTDAEIVLFWRALSQSTIDERTQLVLKLLLLTGQRPSEVRCAEAGELRLDGEHPEWHLPGIVREKGKPPKRRTKNGLPHLVPLPPLPANLRSRACGRRAGRLSIGHHQGRRPRRVHAGSGDPAPHESGKLACKPFSPKTSGRPSRPAWPGSASYGKSATECRTTSLKVSATRPITFTSTWTRSAGPSNSGPRTLRSSCYLVAPSSRSRGPDERPSPLRRKAHALVNLPAALELAATQLLHRGLQVHTEDVRL